MAACSGNAFRLRLPAHRNARLHVRERISHANKLVFRCTRLSGSVTEKYSVSFVSREGDIIPFEMHSPVFCNDRRARLEELRADVLRGWSLESSGSYTAPVFIRLRVSSITKAVINRQTTLCDQRAPAYGLVSRRIRIHARNRSLLRATTPRVRRDQGPSTTSPPG